MEEMKEPTNPREYEYASLFWSAEKSKEPNKFLVVVGWSILGMNNTVNGKGAWHFGCEYTPKDKTLCQSEIMDLVEEPIGIMAPLPDEIESGFNQKLERIISDNILLFVHRCLFGDRYKGVIQEIDPNIKPVDIVLIFGPTLPKAIGRLCYTHFTREKTVSIIAPDAIQGRPPTQGQSWQVEPIPPFRHDHSTRKWLLCFDSKQAKQAKNPVCSFEIVMPIGDTVIRSSSKTNYSENIWSSKATIIKEIMQNPITVVQTPYWNGEKLYLPKGMAISIERALLHKAEVSYSDKIAKIRSDLLKQGNQGKILINVFDVLRKRVGSQIQKRGSEEQIVDAVLLNTWILTKEQIERSLAGKTLAITEIMQEDLFGETTGQVKREARTSSNSEYLPRETLDEIDRHIQKSIEKCFTEEIGKFSET